MLCNWSAIMLLITSTRRRRLRNLPFPPGWLRTLETSHLLYKRLSEPDREELRGHIQVLVSEKNFEGRYGLVMNDDIRVTVAAEACLLLLHRETDYFPGLSSIVVYPGEYLAPFRETDDSGVVTEGIDRRSGESWEQGTLVLSWEDVLTTGGRGKWAYNVVIHEFAHQLDAEDGVTNGVPLLSGRSSHRQWQRTLAEEYKRLGEAEAHGLMTVLDPYGAESPAEFFAVATESFFENPKALKSHNLALYEELTRYYRQDPANWPGSR